MKNPYQNEPARTIFEQLSKSAEKLYQIDQSRRTGAYAEVSLWEHLLEIHKICIAAIQETPKEVKGYLSAKEWEAQMLMQKQVDKCVEDLRKGSKVSPTSLKMCKCGHVPEVTMGHIGDYRLDCGACGASGGSIPEAVVAWNSEISDTDVNDPRLDPPRPEYVEPHVWSAKCEDPCCAEGPGVDTNTDTDDKKQA